MKKFMLLLLLLIIIGASAGAFAAAGENVTPPPALHIPYGGKIITDVNIGDGDVLGIIKEVLPTLVDAAKTAFSEAGDKVPQNVPDLMKIDMQPLLDSISGVKSVRVVVAKYNKKAIGAEIFNKANAGVAKIGKFTKIAGQTGTTSGSMALYSQADGGGFVGFVYDSNKSTLTAARIVGPVDIAKLVQWASNVGIKVTSPKVEAPDSTPAEPQN